jgi:hypothetical protein
MAVPRKYRTFPDIVADKANRPALASAIGKVGFLRHGRIQL